MTTATHPPQYHPPPSHPGQVKIASGLNFLAGLYLLISGWINGATGGSMANAIILGIVVAILAACRVFGVAGPWASWLNALIGIWMIISPWIYGYAGQPWMWNAIIIGIIMLVLGVWSASAGNVRPNTTPQP